MTLRIRPISRFFEWDLYAEGEYIDSFDDLVEVVRTGDFDDFKRLFDNKYTVTDRDFRGATPLLKTCYYGTLKMVEYLISLEADPYEYNVGNFRAGLRGEMDGCNAFFYAIQGENIEVAEYFLGMGFDPIERQR
jgi:hypothetical protein